MSNLFENLSGKIQHLSTRVAKDSKKYIKSAVSKGEEIGYKGKIQIEIEKLKWELKKKYRKLGEYVAKKKETKSIVDFSHDEVYQKEIDEIIKLKFYIDNQSTWK